MFSGIIERVGEVTALTPERRGGARLTIRGGPRGLAIGESVAVSGACMTVTRVRGATFAVDVSAESLRRTTLGGLRPGTRVNLERSLRLADRLSGHLVFGHVDGTGALRAITPEGDGALYRFALPASLGRYLVEKGSIAVDGISLTVFACTRRSFTVAVIPHTLAVTTLCDRRPGDRVNLESDMLARYVERAMARRLAAPRRRGAP
ncbi:MAG: riboflavin synthase [Deltaproteobacteria bacterium]|nr:riboflavin synthase [Deltaproteobacteria bacterium]